MIKPLLRGLSTGRADSSLDHGSSAGRARARGRAALVLLLALPAGALAQEPGDVRIGITYTPGYLPGLVVTPVESTEGLGEVARVAEAILGQDLEFSDRFEMIEVPGDFRPGSAVNYGLWNQLGAVWLASSQVSGSASAPVLRVSLHDVVFGELKEVKAFSLPAAGSSGFRMAVHRVSDEVVRWATAETGMAATRIVYRRKSDDGASDIWIMDSDGENARRLTNDNSIVYSPDLSPDGSHLLYVSYVNGGPVAYEKNLASGAVQTVSAEEGLNVTPVYSPDGRHILYARTEGDHTELFELQRQPLCCGRRVTYTSVGETLNGGYSPDGRQLVMTSSPLGLPQIYVIPREGRGEPRILSRYVYGERGYATSPDWSPRGDRIAYQAWIENSFQIVTVGPDGSDRRVLTSRGSNEDPSWAPDGRHLVFSSTGRGGSGLLILDTVTGRVRNLTSGRVDQLASWSTSL
ncbi:MAG: PD40 domain-containing protein [Gemmatimonadetes bacterium]|nr:PD40 domain-containing protein [Gemmatimonadota bacterium]